MGSHISSNRMMNDPFDTDSDPFDRDSDSDHLRDSTDVATVLQYLIRSGQVRIFPSASSDSSYHDDFGDELFVTPPLPKGSYVEDNPDTSVIEGSDISQSIKLNAGLYNDPTLEKSNVASRPIPSLLNMRELGMNGRHQFSRGDRCQIYQRYFPNKMSKLGDYNCKVFCGTYARDGDVFMSASQDYCVRVYDSQKSQFTLLKVVLARDVGWSILDTVVSPDGCHFIYCSWSECIHICNVFGEYETHEALPLFPDERRFCVFAMRFSQDGREILGGANDECLYVYNREENQRTLKIKSHEDDVNSVAFADNTSQILFSGGDDGFCKVWDRRTLCESEPKPVGILVGHEDGITYIDSKIKVSTSPSSSPDEGLLLMHPKAWGDGRHLITNSKDQTIKLWDMRMFSPNSSMEVTRRVVRSHNWDYRWQRVPSNLYKPKKKLVGDTSLMTYRGHSVLQTLIRCHFSPEATTGQQYIYTGCAQGRVVIYDVLTGKIKATLNGHHSCVRDVAWHPYRNEIISSSWDGVVGKWTYSGKMEFDSDDDGNDDDDSDCDQYGKADQWGVVKLRRSPRLANLQRRREGSERS